MQEDAFDFNHQQDWMVSSGFLRRSSKWRQGGLTGEHHMLPK